MAGFRDRFLSRTASLAGRVPTRALLGCYQPAVLLPFYHAISDAPLPHINQLYPVKSIKAFREDLAFLLKHFEPVDYPKFVSINQKKEKRKKPAFLLSFDDGLREVADVIAPILKENGISAMFFCNSAFVDNKALFYRYKASLLLDQAAQSAKAARQLETCFSESGTLRSHMLNLTHSDDEKFDVLAAEIGLDFTQFLHQERPYMTSTEIKQLLDDGHHVGGHSIDHPIYENISLEEQLRQTKTSIDLLQKRFKLDYRIFSFPFTDYGVGKQFFDEVQRLRIAEHTFGCAGIKDDVIVNNHQRVALEVSTSTAREIIHAELVYAMGKHLLGKNRIERDD